jgi:hypothetical protein
MMRRCKFVDRRNGQELEIDLVLDDQNIVDPSLSYYGAWFDVGKQGTYPFVLHALEAQADFGSFAPTASRRCNFKIHGKKLIEGSAYEFDDGEHVYDFEWETSRLL